MAKTNPFLRTYKAYFKKHGKPSTLLLFAKLVVKNPEKFTKLTVKRARSFLKIAVTKQIDEKKTSTVALGNPIQYPGQSVVTSFPPPPVILPREDLRDTARQYLHREETAIVPISAPSHPASSPRRHRVFTPKRISNTIKTTAKEKKSRIITDFSKKSLMSLTLAELTSIARDEGVPEAFLVDRTLKKEAKVDAFLEFLFDRKSASVTMAVPGIIDEPVSVDKKKIDITSRESLMKATLPDLRKALISAGMNPILTKKIKKDNKKEKIDAFLSKSLSLPEEKHEDIVHSDVKLYKDYKSQVPLSGDYSDFEDDRASSVDSRDFSITHSPSRSQDSNSQLGINKYGKSLSPMDYSPLAMAAASLPTEHYAAGSDSNTYISPFREQTGTTSTPFDYEDQTAATAPFSEWDNISEASSRPVTPLRLMRTIRESREQYAMPNPPTSSAIKPQRGLSMPHGRLQPIINAPRRGRSDMTASDKMGPG